jgi:DNA-binding LacI/PurR family transcriptional regulator
MSTIYEVAQEANVSPNTVARILAGKGGRPQNEISVLRAAKKLGYVRNQQAATLRSGKSGLIGLIIPAIHNPVFPIFYQILHAAASAVGYQILVSSTFEKSSEEAGALKMFEMNRVEGIILDASQGESDEACDEVIQRMLKQNIPVILAGRFKRNLKCDTIGIRNAQGVGKAVDLLVRIGRRRIAFITGAPSALASIQRLEGYRDSLIAHGLPYDDSLVSFDAFTLDSGLFQMSHLLQRENPPDAVIAANDLLAIGAIKAARQLNINVPKQLSVIGFDDIPLSQYMFPTLTTLRQPQEQIAREAIHLLIYRMESKDLTNPRELAYEPELIIRESS